MSLPPNTNQDEPSVPGNQKQGLVSIMGCEANIHSIRGLEKQIEEGRGDIIKLKRARNSLLNISTRTPPEILGSIFIWSLVREVDRSLGSESHFYGFRKESHNFLLVCHHWFQVASHTPELWTFWGTTLQDWKKRHHRSGAFPLDLVLNGYQSDPDVFFDGSLQDAVRSRVMQGNIRQVHLCSGGGTLTSIVSSLTPDDESAQNENIESIIWRKRGLFPLTDVSNFFARSSLPKLYFLDLSGSLRISSWDRLASRTTLLTALSLKIDEFQSSCTPTTSQLFSILASNPNLQQLVLSYAALPDDADTSTLKVPLCNLKRFSLEGEFRRILGLLRQLILPEALDSMQLSGFGPTVEEISQTISPYMRDYFRRDARFQDRLEVSSSSSPNRISFSVGMATTPAQKPPWVGFSAVLTDQPPPNVLKQSFVDLIVPIPGEHVISFDVDLHMGLPEELLFMMPRIEKLTITGVELSGGFLQPNPDGPSANMKLLPSLRSLCLKDVTLGGGDWNHLATYLAHQTSGGQIISLKMFGCSPCTCMCPGVVDKIKCLVRKFTCFNPKARPVRGKGYHLRCDCAAHGAEDYPE